MGSAIPELVVLGPRKIRLSELWGENQEAEFFCSLYISFCFKAYHFL